MGAVIDGLLAVPMGIALLVRTPRVMHLLVPPVLLTSALFCTLTWWGWHALERWLEGVRVRGIDALAIEPGTWRDIATWILERGAVLALAKMGGFVVFLVAASVVALWTFSIAYEAIAGPFLDEIQRRMEVRWFGSDPARSLDRPPPVDPRRARLHGVAAAGASIVGIALWWSHATDHSALWLGLGPVAIVISALVDRAHGAWLAHWSAAQLRTLLVSVKASALAAVLLVIFFWVKFIPIVGLVLFGMLAGFCTAISLLDIPFSRRRFGLMQRIELMIAHFPAVVAFGGVAGLVFVIPIVGPLVGVPAASIGGLWLLCRLDKTSLRPPEAQSRTTQTLVAEGPRTRRA